MVSDSEQPQLAGVPSHPAEMLDSPQALPGLRPQLHYPSPVPRNKLHHGHTSSLSLGQSLPLQLQKLSA